MAGTIDVLQRDHRTIILDSGREIEVTESLQELMQQANI